MGQTTAEKIFAAHLRDEPFPGTKVLDLDRVLCHEITTPVAIADLEWRDKDRVYDNTKIKAVIDHVTPSKDIFWLRVECVVQTPPTKTLILISNNDPHQCGIKVRN